MPSLRRNQRFITTRELLDRWQISSLDFIAILDGYGHQSTIQAILVLFRMMIEC